VSEKYFLGSADALIQVTATRLVMGDKTFAMKHIVSVRMDKRLSRLLKASGWSVFLSILFFIWVPESGVPVGVTLTSYALLGLSGYWVYRIFSKPYHQVWITTSNGHSHLLAEHKSLEGMSAFKQAIDDAMTYHRRA